MPYEMPEELVPEMFVIGGVCTTSGPSGGGKTHITFQNTDNMLSGKPVFGRLCKKKIKALYICYDRPISAAHAILNKMGLDFTGRMELKSFLFEPKMRLPTVEEVGDCNFIILDGLDFVVPSGKIIDLGAGHSVMRECYILARDTQSAINGIVGHSKHSGNGNGYSFSREKAIGTSAWGRCAETMIVMDKDEADPEGPDRWITLNLINDASRKMHYRFNENGWLLPVQDKPIIEETKPLSDIALEFLAALPSNTVLTREPLLQIAASLPHPIKQTKMYDCLVELDAHKKIVQPKTGSYLKR